MKVLAINGSPHLHGTTYGAIRILSDELEKEGIETKIVHVGNRISHGCSGCGYCRKQEEPACVFDDDAVNECLRLARECDGLIFGSPVYYAGIAGSMKSFLDRFFYTRPDLSYKVGTVCVALRRSGAVTVYQQMNNYLDLSNMLITPGHYWNAVHGSNAEQILSDEEGIQLMRTLGRNMAWLMKTLEYGRKTLPPPTPEPRIYTNFVR